MPSERRNRWKQLLFVTLVGVSIGVLGDVFLSPKWVTFEDVAGGILLSPLIVTFGGGHVSSLGLMDSLLLIGGLLFWPVYVSLAVLWLRSARPPFLWAILPWTAQGFFQVGLRMAVISGI